MSAEHDPYEEYAREIEASFDGTWKEEADELNISAEDRPAFYAWMNRVHAVELLLEEHGNPANVTHIWKR